MATGVRFAEERRYVVVNHVFVVHSVLVVTRSLFFVRPGMHTWIHPTRQHE
jgi:hypothetical protein